MASVVTSLLRGQEARCSHGKQVRDFLYVDDVASAFVSLLSSNIKGVVNIGSGQPISLQDVIYEIADNLGCRDRVALGVLPTPVNDPSLLVANCTRLHEEVGWQPQYGLPEGIDRTVSYWRNRIGND